MTWAGKRPGWAVKMSRAGLPSPPALATAPAGPARGSGEGLGVVPIQGKGLAEVGNLLGPPGARGGRAPSHRLLWRIRGGEGLCARAV